MKYSKLFSYLLITFILTACSSGSTTETTNNATSEATVEKQKEPTAGASTEAVKVAIKDPINHDKEIALINEAITEINQNIASYASNESKVETETISCKVVHSINRQNALIKSTATCGDNFWEIYCIGTTGNSSKVIYTKLIQKNPEGGRPSVREFYSIGSMIKEHQVYTLILDESGKEIEPGDYQNYNPLYEDAILNFL